MFIEATLVSVVGVRIQVWTNHKWWKWNLIMLNRKNHSKFSSKLFSHRLESTLASQCELLLESFRRVCSGQILNTCKKLWTQPPRTSKTSSHICFDFDFWCIECRACRWFWGIRGKTLKTDTRRDLHSPRQVAFCWSVCHEDQVFLTFERKSSLHDRRFQWSTTLIHQPTSPKSLRCYSKTVLMLKLELSVQAGKNCSQIQRKCHCRL